MAVPEHSLGTPNCLRSRDPRKSSPEMSRLSFVSLFFTIFVNPKTKNIVEFYLLNIILETI